MFAVLHIADFALHAVLRTERDGGGVPAALLDDVGKRALILSCNDRARARGVSAGQTAPQALAHCGELRLYARSRPAEAEARAVLLAAGFALSPRLELTADGVGTADLRGLAEARQRRLLLTALEQLRTAALPATGGLAATPLLALYAARSVGEEIICLVHDARAFLASLPLAAADPEPELAAILTAWGVPTLGALTALPKEDVARRLGPAGLALWERAAGETTRVLRLVEPAREFVAVMEFEHEIETLEPLLFILQRFVARFALELATAYVAAAELALELELADDTKHARSFRLPEPTTQADILFRTLHTHLESLRTDASIKAVRLRVEPTRPPHRQQGLFETALRDPHGFAETLARVGAIVGSDRVGTPYVQDTHRPDAVVLEPPAAVVPPPGTGDEAERRSRPAIDGDMPLPAGREDDGPLVAGRLRRSVHAAVLPPLGLPLRRFRPPIPARVELENGHYPASVWSAHVSGMVDGRRGPWRGSGEWWEAGREWEREEWDVQLSGGGLYRIVRTKDSWLVEGEYD